MTNWDVPIVTSPGDLERFIRKQSLREPVWPSGKALHVWGLGSNPLRLAFLFKSCGLWTLSCDFVPHN